MRFIHFLLVFLTSFLSPNNTAVPAPNTNRVVTQIQVTAIHDGQATVKTYTDNTSMESILTYLRLTEPTVTTQFEPDSFRSDSYAFTLCYSDGSRTTYRQIHHDYLQKDSGRWQKISPKAGLLFPTL